MLEAASDSYVAAQTAGDLSRMSLAEKVRYRESMIDTTREKGLWNTALPIAFHRSVHDVPRCRAFTEVVITEGGHPSVLGTAISINLTGEPIVIDPPPAADPETAE